MVALFLGFRSKNAPLAVLVTFYNLQVVITGYVTMNVSCSSHTTGYVILYTISTICVGAWFLAYVSESVSESVSQSVRK